MDQRLLGVRQQSITAWSVAGASRGARPLTGRRGTHLDAGDAHGMVAAVVGAKVLPDYLVPFPTSSTGALLAVRVSADHRG